MLDMSKPMGEVRAMEAFVDIIRWVVEWVTGKDALDL